jgi:Zn-dependent protease with chaperone function
MTNRALRPLRRRLEGISPRAWEHPADRAALSALQSLPGFDEVLRKIVGAFGERGTRLAFQANAVRVSAKQFPRLQRLWLEVHETLDAPQVYELYVSQSPAVDAGAYGLDRPWVMLLSGSLRLMSDDEIAFLMGHELGHVLSGHALYHTLLVILVQLALAGFPFLLSAVATPVLLALLEWYRKSEISSDRAGLLAMQLPDAAMGTMMRLAGGGIAEEMELNEFLLQAEEYRGADGLIDQVLKVLGTLRSTHPFLVVRAALLRDWIEEGAYDRILRGEYPRRGGDAPGWMDDVAAGVRYYTDSMQGAAEKAGEAARRVREAFERGFRGGKPEP